MIYLELFGIFFLIGLFSFGGGYAAMPWILSLVVEQKGWLTLSEYADLTSIAEMTPGPIGVNAATFVGQKMAGLPGALFCTLGCITPSLIIVLLLALLYQKYRDLSVMKNVLFRLRPAVVSLIASAGVTILLLALFNAASYKEISLTAVRPVELCLFLVSLLLLRKTKISPIAVLLLSAAAGTLLYLFL